MLGAWRVAHQQQFGVRVAHQHQFGVQVLEQTVLTNLVGRISSNSLRSCISGC